MPSFPTAVFSPSAKSNGQIIQASHVNDLQDEVVAIEGALLNGPLTLASVHVSGNSTLGNVNVTGGSTVNTLNVTGGSTFATRPVFGPPDATYLTGSTTNLPNASSTPLTWPTQAILVNSSAHSTATNADKVFPQSTGVYMVTASIVLAADFTNGSTASLQLHIKDSSGGRIASQRAGSAGSISVGVQCSGLKRFDTVGSTQWARVVATQQSGSTHSVLGTHSFLQFVKL